MIRTSSALIGMAMALVLAPASTAGEIPVQMASAPAAAGAAVTLNPVVAVTAAEVRLGDLFAGPLAAPETRVLRAPAPGERMLVDADTLSRIARLNGVDWRPYSRDIRVVVKRSAAVLSQEEILESLRVALETYGAPENAEIRILGPSLALAMPADAIPRIEVGRVLYEPRMDRFSAVLDITGTLNGSVVFARELPVRGRVFPTERVPVLTAALNRGDIIREGDVTYATLRSALVREGAITDARALIGKEAKAQIREGVPIRATQVQTPILVRRDAQVVMYYALSSMNLTAKGKALDAGGQGDVIRVLNPKSNRTVIATVVKPNQVVVEDTAQALRR